MTYMYINIYRVCKREFLFPRIGQTPGAKGGVLTKERGVLELQIGLHMKDRFKHIADS